MLGKLLLYLFVIFWFGFIANASNPTHSTFTSGSSVASLSSASATGTILAASNTSSSLSNLSALNPPPGFNVNLVFNSEILLNPIGVYNIALDTMYRLAQNPWDSIIRRSLVFSRPDFNERIVFDPIQASDRLRNGYAVLALYSGVCAMTPPTRNLFFELILTITAYRRPAGRCIIQRLPTMGENGINDLTNRPDNLTVLARNDMSHFSNGHSLTADSGSMIDSEDSRFRLAYTFLGTRINSQKVFLAVMDGIAAAARMNAGSRCDRLIGVTPNTRGMAVITVSALQHPSGFKLTWQYASRAILLISRIMQAANRFERMRFQLKHDGVDFGEGLVAY